IFVYLQALVKTIKIWIPTVCVGRDRRSFRIAFAADFLALCIGVGKGFGTPALAVGAGMRSRFLALRPQLVGELFALVAHAVIHSVGGLVRQRDALEAHVNDVNPDILDGG